MDEDAEDLTAHVRLLLRALIGVSKERLGELVLFELEEREVRHLAFYMLAAEHEGYNDTLASLFEGSDPVPESLQRIAQLEARVDLVSSRADDLVAGIDRVTKMLSCRE